MKNVPIVEDVDADRELPRQSPGDESPTKPIDETRSVDKIASHLAN
jgi:hypothetical protein